MINDYYENIIKKYEQVNRSPNAKESLVHKSRSLEERYNNEEVQKRHSNSVYEYDQVNLVNSDRIIREYVRFDDIGKKRIIVGLSNLSRKYSRSKLQEDESLLSTIFQSKEDSIRQELIELVGRNEILSRIGFLLEIIKGEKTQFLPRAFYHYACLASKHNLTVANEAVVKTLYSLDSYSQSMAATILSGLHWVCSLGVGKLNRIIFDYLKPLIADVKYLDASKHLASFENPAWSLIRIFHDFSQEGDLEVLYKLIDLNVDVSSSLRAIVRIKKEKAIPEVLDYAQNDYSIARYALLDLAKLTTDHSLVFYVLKFVEEADDLDYELMLISNDLKEIVDDSLFDYLRHKDLSTKLLGRLEKLISVNSIGLNEFRKDLEILLNSDQIPDDVEPKWDTALKLLHESQKMAMIMKMEEEKDVFNFNSSIREILSNHRIRYQFSYNETKESFSFWSSINNGEISGFEIEGHDRWILNDPSFYAYYINHRLNELNEEYRLVQIPPFETHIFIFGDQSKIHTIVERYNV